MKYKSVKYVLIAASIVLSLIFPKFIETDYFLHIAIMVCVNAVLGIGFSMLYGVGLITLGAAAFYGIGAYASALLVMRTGIVFWLAAPIAVLITALIAALVGSLIVRYPGVGFVVFTMVIAFILQRVWGAISSFGGWGGIINIPIPHSVLRTIDFSVKSHFYYLSLLILTITILSFLGLYRSRIGRAWRAIKLDSRLAESVGINLYAYRLAAFIIASAFIGLAGTFYAHYAGVIMPDNFDLHKSIDVQIYSILGGLDHLILGPVIGSLIFTAVPQLLGAAPEIEPYLTGCLLIVLVIFLPFGLAGLVQRR